MGRHAIFWRSSDHGQTWSSGEERLDILGREFSMSVLSDGTLLMPAADLDCHPGCPYPSRLFRSTDKGSSWTVRGLRLPGVGWSHTNSDRTVVEVDGTALLGISCSGDSTKPAPCPKNLSSFWRSTESAS